MRTRQVLTWIVITLMASPVLAAPTDLKSILDGSRHVLIVPVEPPPLTISPPGFVNQVAQAAGVEGETDSREFLGKHLAKPAHVFLSARAVIFR